MASNSPSQLATRLDAFFDALAQDGNFSAACRVAGMHRANVYKLIREDQELASRYEDALEHATDMLEAEARRRALEGTEEPVFFQGAECGRVRKYSDSLMALLLKANRAKFRDSSRIELGNVPGETFKTEEPASHLARRMAFVISQGLREVEAQASAPPETGDGSDLG